MSAKSQKPGHSFTARYNYLSDKLLNEVETEAWDYSGQKPVKVTSSALWDTGATITIIRPEIVAKLGITPFTYAQISTPNGISDCGMYYVNIYLKGGLKVERVKVLEAFPENCDMLIGMDIIGMGDFAVTNYDGKTTFSFRVPSEAEIDFEKT